MKAATAMYERIVEGCPCDGCPQRALCASEKLACTDFQYWTNHGGHEKPRRAVPSRSVFAQIFTPIKIAAGSGG